MLDSFPLSTFKLMYQFYHVGFFARGENIQNSRVFAYLKCFNPLLSLCFGQKAPE